MMLISKLFNRKNSVVSIPKSFEERKSEIIEERYHLLENAKRMSEQHNFDSLYEFYVKKCELFLLQAENACNMNELDEVIRKAYPLPPRKRR